MSSLLQAATGYEALLRVRDPQVPYRFDRIFQGEGLWARRRSRQRFQLLRRLESDLARMLEAGEQVEYVSWGVEYSFVEAYFLGLWHYVLNRRAVVLTDRRILLLQIDSRRRLRDLKYQLRYDAIRRFARRTFGYLGLELHGKQKLFLTGLPRADRKAIRARIEQRIQSGTSTQRAVAPAGKQNLCPHCYRPVQGFPERCGACAGAFKSGARAGWLSLALPGLGDLYLGHRTLGVVEALGALCAWGVALPAVWSARGPTGGAALAAVAGFVFVAVHGVDGLITRHTGRKGIYPARSAR
jgi:hypothetical protein